jgi:colicin import membrane protein
VKRRWRRRIAQKQRYFYGFRINGITMLKQVGGTILSDSLPGGYPPDQPWKLPLFLAIAIHVAVAVAAITSPSFSLRRAALPEIYTVNLFSATDISSPAPAGKPAEPERMEPAPAPPPPVETRPVEVPPPKMESAATQPAIKEPPISERPIRSKTASDEAMLRELRAKMAAQDALEKQKAAEREIEKALADIRTLHRDEVVTQPVNPSPPAPAARPAAEPGSGGENGQAAGMQAGGSRGSAILDLLKRQYLAEVQMRIQQHWKLPDLQSWDASLEARFAIDIRKDGTVTKGFFEKRSQNYHFDQFVLKAVRDASPLPPFPPGLDEERLELGFRFRPGEIL